MIEDKLSKLNETVPKASKSINKRNEIYQRWHSMDSVILGHLFFRRPSMIR